MTAEKKCKLVKCFTVHVVRDNLSQKLIDFIAHISYQFVFERKVNCMAIFSLIVKKKFDFSSDIHVL